MSDSIKPEAAPSSESLEQTKSNEKAADQPVTSAGFNRAQRRQASVAPAQAEADPVAVPVVDIAPVVVEQETVSTTEPKAPDAPAVYKLAANKSMNSPRGWLSDGSEVFVSDFGGDQARMDELVVAGALVRS